MPDISRISATNDSSTPVPCGKYRLTIGLAKMTNTSLLFLSYAKHGSNLLEAASSTPLGFILTERVQVRLVVFSEDATMPSDGEETHSRFSNAD